MVKKELKKLERVVDILNKHHIHFWMYGATLPAYIKDKDIFPWHRDIDLIIWRKDLPRLVKIRKEFGMNYTFKGYTLTILEDDESFAVDISSFKKEGNKAVWYQIDTKNKVGRILYYGILSNVLRLGLVRTAKITKKLISKTNSFKVIKHEVPVHFFENLKEWDYFGMKINVPRDTEEFLDYHYGDYWRIPTKEQDKNYRRPDDCHPDYYQVIKS